MDSIVQHLICPICKDTILGGYFITCQHCFCLNCIKSHVASRSHWDYNKCPICRKKFDITEMDLDGDYSYSIINKIIGETHGSEFLEQRKREMITNDYLSNIKDAAINQKMSIGHEETGYNEVLMDIPIPVDPLELHITENRFFWSELLLFITVVSFSLSTGMRYGDRSDREWRISGYGIHMRKIIGDICAFVLWLAVIIFCFYNVNLHQMK